MSEDCSGHVFACWRSSRRGWCTWRGVSWWPWEVMTLRKAWRPNHVGLWRLPCGHWFHSEPWEEIWSELVLMGCLWLRCWEQTETGEEGIGKETVAVTWWELLGDLEQWTCTITVSLLTKQGLLGVWEALSYCTSPWTWTVNYPQSFISTPWHGSLLGWPVPCSSWEVAINSLRFCSHQGNRTWSRLPDTLITTLSSPPD